MPYFDFLDESDIRAGMIGFQVMAHMAFPTDPLKRQEFKDVMNAWFLKLADRPGNPPVVWRGDPSMAAISQLLHRRSLGPAEQQVWREVGTVVAKGLVAGEALILIQQLAIDDPKRASVNKACHMLAAAGKAGQGVSGHMPIRYRNPKSLRDQAWTPYKSVAHLWAAHNILDQETYGEMEGTQKRRMVFFDPRDTLLLLALAEEYRCFGETHIPHGQTGSTLSPDETWQVPSDFPLPERPIDVSPITNPVHLQALRTYRTSRTPGQAQ